MCDMSHRLIRNVSYYRFQTLFRNHNWLARLVLHTNHIVWKRCVLSVSRVSVSDCFEKRGDGEPNDCVVHTVSCQWRRV